MANIRFPSNGSGTFSDGLVGGQNTEGNDFTQKNFSEEGTPVVRDTKSFTTSDFSKPISLEDLNSEESIKEVSKLFDQSLKIKFNTEKGSKDLFGSAFLRAKVAVENIANTFPASLRVFKTTTDAQTVDTAYDVVNNLQFNTTTFKIPLRAIRNPLGIEYSNIGLKVFDGQYDSDRNFAKEFTKYVLLFSGVEYKIKKVLLPEDRYNGELSITVHGKPFTGSTQEEFYIKLNDILFEKKFELMDDFEQLLLDRENVPLYEAKFKVPKETSDGNLYFGDEKIKWELSDDFNIVVEGDKFERYLEKLFETCEVIDNYKANLIARFLSTASLQEFDTEGQKVKKIFQLYGRFFDDVKKFIDNIAYMNNVTYDKINNVPDLLLKNLAGLLGLDVITSITDRNIEEYLYKKKDSQFDGLTKGKTPFETDIEIYRRIILNSAYLFKSKGTRKPLRFLLSFIGAPESFVEINEYVYKVINRIDYDKFSEKLDNVIDGEWFESDVDFKTIKVWSEIKEEWLDKSDFQKKYPNVEIDVLGYLENGQLPDGENHGDAYILYKELISVEVQKSGGVYNVDDYPIERVGTSDNSIPKTPTITNDYFFQKGAGWFERTDSHKSVSVLDEERSDLTTSPKTIKTKFEDFTYGEKFYDRYKNFPNFDDGWELKADIDNKKSDSDTNKFILNRKNVDIFLNPGRAVLFDFVRTYQKHSLSYSGVLLNNLTFAQFSEYGFWNGVEVGKGKYGKKYWDLIELFKDYYESGLGKAYDYDLTYAYLNKISTYWIRLVEQFIPATTLWFTGEKVENHNLHRPKFNWEEPCRNDVMSLDLSLAKTLYETLIDSLKKYKNIPDCYERLYRYGNWYLQVKINDKIYQIGGEEWTHFFTSTESDKMGSCNLDNAQPGSPDTCPQYDNPIYMLCDFETYVTCYPDECKDFVTTIVQMLSQISKDIYRDEIADKVSDCDFLCDNDDGLTYVADTVFGSTIKTTSPEVEGLSAFEIEGFKDGEFCYDCHNEIKLITNSYCGECFDIDSLEIGMKVIINEGEGQDDCKDRCFVLENIPFSIDQSQFGGVHYDVNYPDHHIDMLDPRGTVFLTEKFEVVKCVDYDKVYHGTYQYVGGLDTIDRFPVYKHITEDIYLSCYPDAPESVNGDFMFTEGPKGSYTQIYGKLSDKNLLDFTNVFTHSLEWEIDDCITVDDLEEDQNVIRHRYATGDSIGICDRVNDDGFDYVKIWLHGGTFEAQDGTTLPYDMFFDCKEDLVEGETIWYDEAGDVFIVKIKSGENRLIHAYDQSGAPIHIYLKERNAMLVGLDFETDLETIDEYGGYGQYGGYGGYGQYSGYGGYGDYTSYGGYGQYGGYGGYGGYFCYGNEYLFYSNINPYCVGRLDYEIRPECQGYLTDTEFYRVKGETIPYEITIDEVIVGENVETVRVQDINVGDLIIAASPNYGEMDFCDYSEFQYGNEGIVCNYTKNIKMVPVMSTSCGRIYKYININEGRVKVEFHHNILVLEDLNKTNSNDLLTTCYTEAPTKPIGTIYNLDGTPSQVFYDNEYQIISKPANEIGIGDYIITTEECGVIEVKSLVYDDYCDEGLFNDKYQIKFDEDMFAWYRPKDGYYTIYINDKCVPYCELICCDEIEMCIDDITIGDICIDDISYVIGDVPTTTTSTTEEPTTTTSTTKDRTTTTSTTEEPITTTSTTEDPTTTTSTTEDPTTTTSTTTEKPCVCYKTNPYDDRMFVVYKNCDGNQITINKTCNSTICQGIEFSATEILSGQSEVFIVDCEDKTTTTSTTESPTTTTSTTKDMTTTTSTTEAPTTTTSTTEDKTTTTSTTKDITTTTSTTEEPTTTTSTTKDMTTTTSTTEQPTTTTSTTEEPTTTTSTTDVEPLCVCIEFTHISTGPGRHIGYYDDCDGIQREIMVNPLESEKVCGTGLNISTSDGKLIYQVGEECDKNRKCPSDETTTTTSFREPDDPTTTTSTTEDRTTTTSTTEEPTTTTSTTMGDGGSGPITTTTTRGNNETTYCVNFDWLGSQVIPQSSGKAYADSTTVSQITEFYLYDVACGNGDFDTLANALTTGYGLTVSRGNSTANFTLNSLTNNSQMNYWTLGVTYNSGTVTQAPEGLPCHQPNYFCFTQPILS